MHTLALTLTAEELATLRTQLASGITEIDVPGGQRIRYADVTSLRKLLAEAEAGAAGTPDVASGARTFARFCRDL